MSRLLLSDWVPLPASISSFRPTLHTISLLSSGRLAKTATQRRNQAQQAPNPTSNCDIQMNFFALAHSLHSQSLSSPHVLSAIEPNPPHTYFSHQPAGDTHATRGAKPPFVASACGSRRFEILVMGMLNTRLASTDISREPSEPRGFLSDRDLFRSNLQAP